jgi:radical SAM superfamily enzyme YgiQ (UPF0313 family)
MSAPFVLLINPWIHDFAAYDLWVSPVGLLSIAGLLRRNGFGVHLIDLLSPIDAVSNQEISVYKSAGQGHFLKQEIPKPPPLHNIRRRYSRYGMPPDSLYTQLSILGRPDVVIITSMMTYWYPGVFETIRLIRSFYRDVPILLGGIYATLCHEHAVRYADADYIIPGLIDRRFCRIIESITGRRILIQDGQIPYPDNELIPDKRFIPIISSHGCAFRCAYCASSVLHPVFYQYNPRNIVDYIEYWAVRSGSKDFVFYDDALLINPEEHIIPLLRLVMERKLNIRFHTPNGLHIRQIDHAIAELMMMAGFKTIRLGLESCDDAIHNQLGNKTSAGEFIRAAAILKDVGFSNSELGVYVLAGLPGQRWQSAEDTVHFVLEHNMRPMIAEYSPIPGTRLWPLAVQCSPFPIDHEPLFQNNTLLPCQSSYFTLYNLQHLKEQARAASRPQSRNRTNTR